VRDGPQPFLGNLVFEHFDPQRGCRKGSCLAVEDCPGWIESPLGERSRVDAGVGVATGLLDLLNNIRALRKPIEGEEGESTPAAHLGTRMDPEVVNEKGKEGKGRERGWVGVSIQANGFKRNGDNSTFKPEASGKYLWSFCCCCGCCCCCPREAPGAVPRVTLSEKEEKSQRKKFCRSSIFKSQPSISQSGSPPPLKSTSR